MKKFKSTGISYGSGTIINGIATGKGSAFGIDLKVKCSVELYDDGKGIITGSVKNNPSIKPNLLITSVKNTLKYYGYKSYSGHIVSESELPIKSGLSSSSATSNAAVLATIDALGEKIDDNVVIELGIKSSFDEKLTITGAYDDATASYFGGITITDNINRKLLKRGKFKEDIYTVIFIPNLNKNVNVNRMKLIGRFIEIAFKECLNGNYYEALFLNGISYAGALGFPTEYIFTALEAGAITSGLSGTGPSYISLVYEEDVKKVSDSLEKYGKTIITKPTYNKATVI